MMEEEKIIAYLEENDHEIDRYTSDKFNYLKALLKFISFLSKIQDALQSRVIFQTGYRIQDASYHSEISLPDSALISKKDCSAGIIFSNFGDMVTIINEESIKSDNLKLILDLFNNLGYVYIPLKYLEAGHSKRYPLSTWRDRYFNYI
jgi:hypothetical protein